MDHRVRRGIGFTVAILALVLASTASADLDERQQQLVAEITEKTGYELVQPEYADDAHMARMVRGYPVVMMGSVDHVWERWAMRVAAGEVGRELGGVWAYLTGSTEYGTGVTGSVFDELLSSIMGQPITFTMILHHNRPDTPRIDLISNQFPHRPTDLPEQRMRIAFGTGHLHSDDPQLAEAIAKDKALRDRLRKLRSQYLRIDSETVSFYFAGNEREYASLINRHGDYYQMVNALTELLADLADQFAEDSGYCSSELQGNAPKVDEIPVELKSPDQPGIPDQLEVRMLDEHRLIVKSHGLDLPDLAINGSSGKFTWHSVNGMSVVVLEQCDLAKSSLTLSAGSQFLEWVGPSFFKHRPDTGAEAESLRTFTHSSKALSHDREIYLVVPDGWDGASGDPLLISGDALAGSTFGAIVETLAANRQSRPVAFASARFGDGMLTDTRVPLRSAEYHLPPESSTDSRQIAYANHETFFFQEFLPTVVGKLGGETGPIFLFGISSSASFALEQGLMHSDSIAGIIAASPPIHQKTIALADKKTTDQTIQLWCGTIEDLFCNRISALAESHGFQLSTLQASHDSALWEEALSTSIVELFPPTSK